MANSAKKPAPAGSQRVPVAAAKPLATGKDAKAAKPTFAATRDAWPGREEPAGPTKPPEFRVEASARPLDAAIAHRGDDRGDDAGHRLAAALGARLSCRRGAQASEAEARLRRKWTAPASIRSPVALMAKAHSRQPKRRAA